jgi:hypothetical membrane protein
MTKVPEMSIAVRPAVPSAFFPALGRRVLRRVDDIPTMHLAGLVLVVLVGGILASILTTSDPLWWQLHFSQLGTFGDLSAAFFNTTLKVGGSLVVVFAVRVRRDLRRLGRRAGRRGAATASALFLTVIGVNLALVGCVPLNTDKDLHDKVAGMMVLGFAALLLTSPFLLHRLPKRLVLTTSLVFVFLFAGAWLFVTATINLALFEVIAFSAMFAWSGVFTQCLAGSAARREPAVETAQQERVPSRVRTAVAAAFASRPAAPLTALTRRTVMPGTAALDTRPARRARVCVVRRGPVLVSGARAALVGSAGARPASAPARPSSTPPRLRRPSTAPRVGRSAAPALPRRGCTASAARGVSGMSTTRARRSPRRPAAAR